jgi:hypothetical protein
MGRLGEEVEIGGLLAGTRFNGERGILAAWDPAARRFRVRLTTGPQRGAELAVAPVNLALVTGKAAAAAAAAMPPPAGIPRGRGVAAAAAAAGGAAACLRCAACGV